MDMSLPGWDGTAIPARLGAHPKAEGGAHTAGTALPSSTPLRMVHMPSLPRTHRLDPCVGQASSVVCPGVPRCQLGRCTAPGHRFLHSLPVHS